MAFIALCLLVAPLSAQDEAPSAPPDIRAFLDAEVGLTRLHGEASTLLGGAAGLRVSDSWAFGGAGYVLPSAIEVGEVEFQEVEMLLGFAGIAAEWRPGPGASWFVRGVVGAGNVDVRDAATGTQLDSDNVFVLAPTAGYVVRLRGPWALVPKIGYRFVTGVQDLRGVEPADLRSVSFGVAIRLSPL